MALIKCKECGKEISNTSKVCVHCGAKTEKEIQRNKDTKQTIKVCSIFIIIIGIIAISIYLINANSPIAQYKKEAIEVLENLKDKDITVEQAENEIGALQKKFENTYKNKIENNVDYSCFSLHLSTLEISLYLDNINGITNTQINEYIKELKKQ